MHTLLGVLAAVLFVAVVVGVGAVMNRVNSNPPGSHEAEEAQPDTTCGLPVSSATYCTLKPDHKSRDCRDQFGNSRYNGELRPEGPPLQPATLA